MFQLPPAEAPPGGPVLPHQNIEIAHFAFKVTAATGVASAALFFISPVIVPLALSVLSLIPAILLAVLSKGNHQAFEAGATLSLIGIKGAISLFSPMAGFIYSAKVAYIASYVFAGLIVVGLAGMYFTRP